MPVPRGRAGVVGGHDVGAQPDGPTEEEHRLDHDHHDWAGGEGGPGVRGRDDRGHRREDDEAEHVVDDGRAEDHPRLGGLGTADVLEHPRGDADAGGRERGAEEQVSVPRVFGQEPDTDKVPEDERYDHTDAGHHERRAADLRHLRDRGLQAHLEQQQDHPQLAEGGDHRVGERKTEGVPAEEPQVSEGDPRDELTQHRGLVQPEGNVPAKLGDPQEDGQREERLREGLGTARSKGQAREYGRNEEEHREEAAHRT